MRRSVVLVVLSIAVAGCLLPARVFSVVVPGKDVVNDLPVTLEDRTGLVQALGPAQPGQFNLGNGVKAGDDPSLLVVTWLGGACDKETHLTFEARGDGYAVLERTDRADSCRAGGVIRTVTVGLARPIDAGLVALDSELDVR